MLIALGVTGGIGAYKAVEVARGLQKRGHDVAAIMTASAKHFVGEVTFEAITRRPVISDQFARGLNADIEHIALATEISLLVIAPATANVIAKLANGIADDFLTSLYLATRAPVLLAPAMNTQMLEHPAVQQNLGTLAARGVRFVDPGEGFLACGWIGKGRLAEPDDIVAAAEAILRPSSGTLIGRRIVVSAGPTYEDLDPVRYIGNRSSGRMGYAIAAEAARRGAHVVLVSGPTRLDAPEGVTLERVRSAAEMARAVREHAQGADAVVMAAAVADYTPERPAAAKLPKSDGPLQITLVRTTDILQELGQGPRDAARPVLVGFAAETGDPRERARRKLARKQVDLIVANDVSRGDAGFDVETNAAILIDANGETETPVQPKAVLAGTILDRVERLLTAAAAQPARS